MLHITEIKPMFTGIVTTGDRYKEDQIENGLITAPAGSLKLNQVVVAVGSTVRDIKVGDQVMINPAGYAVRKYDKNSIQNDLDNNPTITYNFNWVNIEDKDGNVQECLLLNDRDILYVFNGYETNEQQVIYSKPKIILPGDKNIIV